RRADGEPRRGDGRRDPGRAARHLGGRHDGRARDPPGLPRAGAPAPDAHAPERAAREGRGLTRARVPDRRGGARPPSGRARRRQRDRADHAVTRGARRVLAALGEPGARGGAVARARAHHRLPQARARGRRGQGARRARPVGPGIGVVLAAAAFLTVTTATTLILHARRAETEIMRLVGATETTIWLPLLLQGTMQGLIGAVLALAALVATHSVVAPRLEPLV